MHTVCKLSFLICSLLLAPQAFADAVVVLRADRMLDVVSGQILNNRSVVVIDQRIERVVPTGSIDLPDDARIVDLGDSTLLPGLIDMHVHLTGDHTLQGYNALAPSIPRQALYGAKNAQLTLQAGFTTVRNVGAAGFADVALRDAIRDGDIAGPRMRVAGRSLGVTGGHCDDNLLPSEYRDRAGGVADGPWAVRGKVRENIKYGADVIKFCATGGVLSKGTSVGAQQYTLEEMQALVSEAHQRGRNVAAHAHGTDGIKAAIRAGVDSVEHASLIDAEGIRMALDAGTFLVMDVYVSTFILEMGETLGILPESLAKERQVGAAQRSNFQRAHEAGVRMAFGSDAGVYPHGDNAKQFAYMVQHGMTPAEAIRAATVDAAELIDWADDIGRLEAGYLADIIAVRGNPLSDVRSLENVHFVMKDGTIYRQ